MLVSEGIECPMGVWLVFICAMGGVSGRVFVQVGAIMAASDRFNITVRGQGGHAGLPHRLRDPVVAAAAVVGSLQPLVSREVAPSDSAVVSVSRFNTGALHNAQRKRLHQEHDSTKCRTMCCAGLYSAICDAKAWTLVCRQTSHLPFVTWHSLLCSE